LADSIRTNGFVQPIIVRPHNNAYQIIAGERRFRAAKILAMASVPAIIRDATDEQMVELALVENIQREDLNPVDRARAYHAFADRFHLSPDQIAQRLGEDRTTVLNYMRIIELQKSVLDLIVARKITMGHARSLLSVADRATQLRLAESAARNELSVRALEELVRRERHSGDAPAQEPLPASSSRVRAAHLKDMEQRFEQAVKTGVTIHEGKRRGTGRITIEYYSLHDFERIAHLLGVPLD
jgi:ParB family chromosome partitioning protein